MDENTRTSWSDEEASSYCSSILGRPVSAKCSDMGGTGILAIADPGDKIRFARREIPGWVFWHEVGHLACMSGGGTRELQDIISSKIPKMERDLSKLEAVVPIMGSDGFPGWEIHDEAVIQEVKAHLWAIGRAITSKTFDVADDLIGAIDQLPQDHPVYGPTAIILKGILKDVV